MQIACPKCATSYRIEASALGAQGRSVRCVRCRNVWFADNPAAAEPVRVLETVGAEAPTAASEPATVPAAVPVIDHTTDETVAAFRSELGSAAPELPAAEAPAAAVVEPVAAEAALPDAGPVDSPADVTADFATRENYAPAQSLAEIPIPTVEAPPLVPTGDEHQAEPATFDNGTASVERAAILRPAPKKSKARGKTGSRMTAAIVVLVVACAAVLLLRKDIVRHMPQLASFYAAIGMPVNLRGLTFTDMKMSRETHDGVPVLVVEGMLVNTVSSTVEVPRMRFGLRNAAGAEIYSWTTVPTQPTLEPGEKLPFRSRLASPPDDGHDVQVRFFSSRDAVAGSP